MKYTTKMKSWALSFVFAVTLLFAGSAVAQDVQVYDAVGTPIGVPQPIANLQAAINTAPVNGEVRILTNATTTTPIVITQNFKLTAGAGGALLTLGGDFTINSGTVTFGTGNNNIDIDLNGNDFTVAAGATFAFVGRGNTITDLAGGSVITINGAYTTTATGVTNNVATSYVIGQNWASNNASPGIYMDDDATVMTGTGTYGNFYWAPTAATTFTVPASFNLNIADGAEVVFSELANITYNGNFTVGFLGNDGAFDVQMITGVAGNGVITNTVGGDFNTEGNLFAGYAVAAGSAMGDVSVSGNATFLSTADFRGFNTLTVIGDLTVQSGAFEATGYVFPVTAHGNVADADLGFRPSLTMTAATNATSTLTSQGNTPGGLNSLVVPATKTVNSNNTAVGINTTLSVTGTFNITGSTSVDVVGLVTVAAAGRIENNGSGAVTFDDDINNTGHIWNTSTGSITFGNAANVDVTTNNTNGNITNSGAGSILIWQLDNANNAFVGNTGSGPMTISDITSPNEGLIENQGSGNMTINDVNPSFTNAATAQIANDGSGTLTITVDVTNQGELRRTAGTFNINGDLTNTGAITNASSTFGGQDYASRVFSALTDGIIVRGDVSSTTNYDGQLIVDAAAATRTITGTFGNLGVRSGAFMVTAGGNLVVGKSLILHAGTFNLAAFSLSLTNTASGSFVGGDTDLTPAHGIMMKPNTMWTNGTVSYDGNGLFGFWQEAAGVPAGSFFVNTSGGQVQLLSNVHVSNITIVSGATVRKPFNAFCFDLVVAGTSTVQGAIIECGVFVITNSANGSIRAQLIAAGFDPDNMNQSIQIAIGAGNWISLTDAVAEGFPGPANNTYSTWKGVTIVDTQSRFIMSSGIVNLNDANLTLRGGFVYAGDWDNANDALRTRLMAGSNGLANTTNGGTYNEVFQNNAGGFLKFTGLNVPNANFVFVNDGVNSTLDGFVIRRLSFERTGNSPIAIVDNNNVNAGNVPSNLVVSEKLYVSGNLSANDNNIKWIGGNNRSYSGSVPANRSLQVATDNLIGAGFFVLANNWISVNDTNTITLLGASETSATDLQMQFRKVGTAGDRTIANSGTDALDGIGTIGNGGMNYVQAGSLVTNELTLVDGDFTLGQDRTVGKGYAVLTLSRGVNFSGNLFVTDNNAAQRRGTGSRMILSAPPSGTAEYMTVVEGSFETGAYADTDYAGYIQTGASAGRVHNLYLKGSIRFGAFHETVTNHATNLGFINPRPSRVVFNGNASQNFLVGGSGAGVVTFVRVPRPRVEMRGAATLQYTIPAGLDMASNDMYLLNGVLLTNGNLAMYDLGTNTRSTDGSVATSNDADFTTAPATENLSIVTRSRTTSSHGQLTRGLGSTGAYTSFAYNANGGAPYTVQHIGDASRFTGDEIPGLQVTNASGNGNNSTLNRLVVDLASNAVGIELTKDLIINNRVEMLTGLIDVATAAYLDIAPNVQWVHGHAILEADFQTFLRFPNSAGNTATGAGSSARYDLWYVSKTNHTTGYEFPAGAGVRHLTVITNGATVNVTLSANKEVSGSVRVVDGVLNLDSKTLKLEGNLIVDGKYNGNDLAVGVNNNNNAMVSGWFPGRSGNESPVLFPYAYGVGSYDNGNGRVNDANGTLEFAGTAKSYILAYVQTANKAASLPHILVTKTGANGQVVFDIDQTFTAAPDEDHNHFYVRSFTQNTGRTDLRPGATVLPAANLNQSDAPASGAQGLELTSNEADVFGAGFTADRIQHWTVRENMTLVTGTFYAWGATMTVEGNYLQGDNVSSTSAVFYAGQGTGSQFANTGNPDYETELYKQVNGNFTVLLDKPANEVNATGVETGAHRYYLSNGWLGVAGNYAFDGHADVTSGIGVPNSNRGFRGTIAFNRAVSFPETAALQSVRHVQSFRGFFNDVVINGRGISLSGTDSDHMWVNDFGVVTFALGNIVTGPARELILQNATVDEWDANEIISGAVYLSGSNSFVEGNLRRYMAYGGTTGGLVEDGYIFPLGQTFTADDMPAFSNTNAAKRFYRPMTLQFPANLGQTIHAVATSLTDGAQMIDPSLKVQGRSGTAQNPGAFYNIDLTTTSDMYWNVKFNQLPALEPNIRLGVQGLLGNQNNNIDDMRIVTPGATQSGWRLAGVYDLTVGGPDDTYNPNDFIDGIPTFIQEGPGLLAQQYNPAIGVDLRVATNSLSNPFDGPGTIAYLQVIHNSPAATVDVLINGITVLNDFTYQSATPFIALAAETAYDIEVKTANGATTLLSINGAVLGADQSYILIAQGGNNGKAFEVKVVDNARRSSTVANGMQYFFSHGVTNGPTVNVERVTTSTPRTLEQLIAVNAAYGSTTSYMTQLNPSISTLQLKAGGAVVGQYLFDFGNYAGETMTLLATGAVGGTGANALTIIGVDAAGNVLRPQVTTSDEGDVATELPAEFTLNGNFPNPFNPTTNISFDLPEQANVRVEIVDLLGRQVMTVAPQSMSAGANKVITVDAARLSSGVYFYRVIAEGATKTFVQGSKFTLVK